MRKTMVFRGLADHIWNAAKAMPEGAAAQAATLQCPAAALLPVAPAAQGMSGLTSWEGSACSGL